MAGLRRCRETFREAFILHLFEEPCHRLMADMGAATERQKSGLLGRRRHRVKGFDAA
jgi:hypothetical protein